MRQPYQVLVYLARPAGSGWEYLLLRRIPDRGGFWQGVTGGLEEGETLADAAARELVEETGLVPTALIQIDYSYSLQMEERNTTPGSGAVWTRRCSGWRGRGISKHSSVAMIA